MAWQDPNGQPDWRDAYGRYGQQGGYDPYGPEPQDTPPPGYHDPYAQQSHGPDPYAYAQDPYARYDQAAYAPPPTPVRTGAPAATIAALIGNIASAVFCCGIGVTWIPGIILAAVALSKHNTAPDTARKLTVGAWICLGVDLIITVVAFTLLGLYGDSQSGPTY